MNRRKLIHQTFSGISVRLITSFSLIFVVMVLIIGWVYLHGIPFTSHKGRIANQREETFKDLDRVADSKKDQLLRWINERRGDTVVIARNTSVASDLVHLRQRVYELTEAGTDEPDLWSLLSRDETYLDLAGYLRTIRDTYGYYDNIQIADAETGIVIVSTDNSTLGTNLSNESFFINALLTQIALISDVTAKSENQPPAMHFSHLVLDGQGSKVSVLVIKVKVSVIMKSILQSGSFLGESGETLLINRNTEVLTPLKYPLVDGTVAEPLQFKIKALPAKLASRGEEGIIETHDYRGEKVLAAYRYISLSEDWGWGMVVKRDDTELFAPIRQEIFTAMMIGVFSVIVLMVLTILITRSITNPIHSLIATAKRIAGGDIGARAKITRSDEVGTLARAFNQMAESLVKAQTGLEEKVKERTKELKIEVVERRRAEEELAKHRDHLEELVKERTKELEEKTVKLEKAQQSLALLLKDVNESRDELDESNKELHDKTKTLEKSRKSLALLLEDVNESRTELDISNIKLEASNKELEAFSYSVSHDLRAPLRHIDGFTKLLYRNIKNHIDEKTQNYFDNIISSSKRMNQLIDDLLIFSRMGRKDVKKTKINMKTIINEAKQIFDLDIKENNIAIIIDDMPEVNIDAAMIKQVWENLISNAIKFTSNEKNPEIHIGSEKDADGKTIFFIKDNGVGFDQKYVDKMFGVFQRLHNINEFQGTGIGLANVKRIIMKHGGEIRAEGKVNKCASFFFTLPDA